MSAAITPVPFWHRLRSITLYPLRGAAGVTLFVLTFGSLLGYIPMLGFVLTIVVWLAAYKYSFEILRATADGRDDAPEVAIEISDGTVWRFIGLQFTFLALIIAAALIAGPIGGLVALLAITLMQPGCIISLAIDGSFSQAINPSTALAIMSRIGAPYFAAFGLLFVIQASAGTAADWLSSVMPAVLGHLVAIFFTFWALFATFHLMGYLVWQYHDALGYEPETQRHPKPALHTESRDNALVEQAQALVRDGERDAALALLGEEIGQRVVPLEAHELYRRLLRAGNDRAAIDAHARLYLHLLMSERKERPALNLFRDALQEQPAFTPLETEHGEQLAERARTLGQAQLARDAWLALLRAHPRHDNAPRWAVDAAMLMAERFGQDDAARRLLTSAQARTTDADLLARIDALLRALPQA